MKIKLQGSFLNPRKQLKKILCQLDVFKFRCASTLPRLGNCYQSREARPFLKTPDLKHLNHYSNSWHQVMRALRTVHSRVAACPQAKGLRRIGGRRTHQRGCPSRPWQQQRMNHGICYRLGQGCLAKPRQRALTTNSVLKGDDSLLHISISEFAITSFICQGVDKNLGKIQLTHQLAANEKEMLGNSTIWEFA